MTYWEDYNKAEEAALNREIEEFAKEAGVPVAGTKPQGGTRTMKEYFYQITMTTKTGKTLYLSMATGETTWSFNPNIACYWNDGETAAQFASRWFKNFKGYRIEEVGIDIQTGATQQPARIRALIQNEKGVHTTTHFTSRAAMNKWEEQQFKAEDENKPHWIIKRERDLEPGEYTGTKIMA